MSLEWSIKDVADADALREGDEPVITQAFVWLALITGLGRAWTISEKYAPEFYARVQLVEKLDGPFVKDRPITWGDVRRRIGMRVNVAPLARAAFLKNVVERDLDKTVAACKKELAKEASDRRSPSAGTAADRIINELANVTDEEIADAVAAGKVKRET